jgi:hypothetical protein
MAPTSDRSARSAAAEVSGGWAADHWAASLRLGIGVAVATAGSLLHDLVEFGRPAVENTGVVAGVLTVGGLLWAVLPTHRRVVRGSMVVVVAVFLSLGALASVLPLPLWPFEPDQSLVHYAVHAVWAGALGVTIWTLLRLPVAAAAAARRDRSWFVSDLPGMVTVGGGDHADEQSESRRGARP